MPIRRTLFLLTLVATALHGCGGRWPFGSQSDNPGARIPPGATEFSCAQGNRLLVRFTGDNGAAWIIYPDREFRLDRVTSAGGDRYTNGISTLLVQSDETTLEESGKRIFSGCTRKAAG